MSKKTINLKGKKVWEAGHRGMVGSSIIRRLASEGCQLLVCDRKEVDLRKQNIVEEWMSKNKPEFIFLAAATVGGIIANSTRPAEFIYDNITIESNIIHTAWKQNVKKLLFLASSCIYPRLADQPIKEESLLSGHLEPTNEWYAIAKIAGIKMCEAYRKQYECNFISAMPPNLYGPNDNFGIKSSHVIPALIVKICEAKTQNRDKVEIWGTGKPRREFMFVDDLADSLIFLMKNFSDSQHINVGVGKDVSIEELAIIISKVVGFSGEFKYLSDYPDGVPQKLLDIQKMNKLGWRAKTSLSEGLSKTYKWYLDSLEKNVLRSTA